MKKLSAEDQRKFDARKAEAAKIDTTIVKKVDRNTTPVTWKIFTFMGATQCFGYRFPSGKITVCRDSSVANKLKEENEGGSVLILPVAGC